MQPKTLTNFFNELATKGVRKQNQFQVVITSGHGDVDSALENITMWANTSKLPSRTQEFADVSYQAYPFKLPTRMLMEQEITMTVKCDAEGEIRRSLLKWMSFISNPAISDGSAGEGDKKLPAGSNVRMLLFDDFMDRVVETYKLVGAVPSVVGEVALSNEVAEVATFDVTLVFQFWELEEADGKFNDIR